MVRIDRRKEAHAGKGGIAASPTGKGKGKGGTRGSNFNPLCIKINQRLAAAGPTKPDEISAIVHEHINTFNSVNVATALHQLAKSVNRSADNPVAQQHENSVHEKLGARAAIVLVSEAADVTPRSLTSIVWAMGKLRIHDPQLLKATVDMVNSMMTRGLLDAFGLANVAWALATLHQHSTSTSVETIAFSEQHASLLDTLASKACEHPELFKPQELCNLLWAFATLKVRHAKLFERFADTAASRMREFTPQGLSQTIWAYSKLNLSKHSLLLAAAAAALPRLPSYDAQSLATLAWSFANLEVEHRPLLAAVCVEAKQRPSSFGTASCSQLLWALSRLSDGVDETAVGALCRQLKLISADETRGVALRPQELLYALGALAKLPLHLEPELPTILCTAAAAVAPKLTANKLGIAAWALSRPLVHARLSADARRLWCVALKERAADVLMHLGWRSIGYVEIALRQLSGLSEDETLATALTEAAKSAIEAANDRCARRNAAPVELLLRHSTAWAAIPRGGQVLVAGFDPNPEIDEALAAKGLVPLHWRRFTVGAEDAAAAPWPEMSKAGPAAACFVRWPWYAAGDAAAMAIRAVSSVVQPDAPLWLCGNLDEGADGALEVVSTNYGQATTLQTSDGATLCHALHRPVTGQGYAATQLKLDGWRSEVAVALPPIGASSDIRNSRVNSGRTGSRVSSTDGATAGLRTMRWTTYPGLFAGGGVDVMTSALLESLPTPPGKGKILDACCGSGTIAAALLEAHRLAASADSGAISKKFKVHCLDADATALAAARVNVPGARKFFLCDGWPSGKIVKYDWIVSNPPVHRGQPDEFSVVLGLIRGARSRLRKGGVLWMVCQVQVPIGRMLAAEGSFAWTDARVSSDGRFVVWSAGRGGGENAESSKKVEKGKTKKQRDKDDPKGTEHAKLSEDEDSDEDDGDGKMTTSGLEVGETKKRDKRERKERQATGEHKRRRLASAEGKRNEHGQAADSSVRVGLTTTRV